VIGPDGMVLVRFAPLGRGDRKTPLTTFVSAAEDDSDGFELFLFALSMLPSYHGMLDVRAFLTTSYLFIKLFNTDT